MSLKSYSLAHLKDRLKFSPLSGLIKILKIRLWGEGYVQISVGYTYKYVNTCLWVPCIAYPCFRWPYFETWWTGSTAVYTLWPSRSPGFLVQVRHLPAMFRCKRRHTQRREMKTLDSGFLHTHGPTCMPGKWNQIVRLHPIKYVDIVYMNYIGVVLWRHPWRHHHENDFFWGNLRRSFQILCENEAVLHISNFSKWPPFSGQRELFTVKSYQKLHMPAINPRVFRNFWIFFQNFILNSTGVTDFSSSSDSNMFPLPDDVKNDVTNTKAWWFSEVHITHFCEKFGENIFTSFWIIVKKVRIAFNVFYMVKPRVLRVSCHLWLWYWTDILPKT